MDMKAEYAQRRDPAQSVEPVDACRRGQDQILSMNQKLAAVPIA
jgi:hypothetical protein